MIEFSEEYNILILILLMIMMMLFVVQVNKRYAFGYKLLLIFAPLGLYAFFIEIYGARGIDIIGKWEEDPANVLWLFFLFIPFMLAFVMMRGHKNKGLN